MTKEILLKAFSRVKKRITVFSPTFQLQKIVHAANAISADGSKLLINISM